MGVFRNVEAARKQLNVGIETYALTTDFVIFKLMAVKALAALKAEGEP